MNKELLEAIFAELFNVEVNEHRKTDYAQKFESIFENITKQNSKSMINIMKTRLIETAILLRGEFREDSFEWFVLNSMIQEKKFKKKSIQLQKEFNEVESEFIQLKEEVHNLQRTLNEKRERRDELYFRLRDLSTRINELQS